MNKRTSRKAFKKLKKLQKEYGKMNGYFTWEEKTSPYDHFALTLYTSPTTTLTVNILVDMLLGLNTRDIISKLEYRWSNTIIESMDKDSKNYYMGDFR